MNAITMDYDTFLDTSLDNLTEDLLKQFLPTQYLWDSAQEITEAIAREAKLRQVDSSAILVTLIDKSNCVLSLHGKEIAICTHVDDY